MKEKVGNSEPSGTAEPCARQTAHKKASPTRAERISCRKNKTEKP